MVQADCGRLFRFCFDFREAYDGAQAFGHEDGLGFPLIQVLIWPGGVFVIEVSGDASHFHEGYCMKADHAPKRTVYMGKDYGQEYYRQSLSVCDDYDPDLNVKEGRY